MTGVDVALVLVMSAASALALIVMVNCGRKYAAASAAVFIGAAGLATVMLVSAMTAPEMQVQHEGVFRVLSWIGMCALLARLGWRKGQ